MISNKTPFVLNSLSDVIPKISDIIIQLEKAKKQIDMLLQENEQLRNQANKNKLEYLEEEETLRQLQMESKHLDTLIQNQQITFILFKGKRLFSQKEVSDVVEKRMQARTIPLNKNRVTEALAKLVPKDYD